LSTSHTAEADVPLMEAVAASDPRAQATVVERLAPRVRRLCRLLCRSAADADDAAQVALIEILRSASTFRVASSLEHWADRIAARAALRVARRARTEQGFLRRWLSPGTLPWGGTSSVSAGEAINLDILLERLSDERRRAFVLHHALDLSVQEIAELTGAPAGTVKDRLVTARKQLRALLERETMRLEEGGDQSS
jgi:RNA polymerase sigma-70 factor (ECF subfamily)